MRATWEHLCLEMRPTCLGCLMTGSLKRRGKTLLGNWTQNVSIEPSDTILIEPSTLDLPFTSTGKLPPPFFLNFLNCVCHKQKHNGWYYFTSLEICKSTEITDIACNLFIPLAMSCLHQQWILPQLLTVDYPIHKPIPLTWAAHHRLNSITAKHVMF